MRPDGMLFVVPLEAEKPPPRANTHAHETPGTASRRTGAGWSSPRRGRSPYTQMFLTHGRRAGNDTPAVLIENSTACQPRVNIPEFVNIPPDGLLRIDAPVTEYYRLIDVARRHERGATTRRPSAAEQALAESPGDAVVHNSYASALAATGRLAEAVAEYRRATALSPDYPGRAQQPRLRLVQTAVTTRRWRVPEGPLLEARVRGGHAGLGGVLAPGGTRGGRHPPPAEGRGAQPQNPGALANLCLALSLGRPAAGGHPTRGAGGRPDGPRNPLILDLLGRLYAPGAGRLPGGRRDRRARRWPSRASRRRAGLRPRAFASALVLRSARASRTHLGSYSPTAPSTATRRPRSKASWDNRQQGDGGGHLLCVSYVHLLRLWWLSRRRQRIRAPGSERPAQSALALAIVKSSRPRGEKSSKSVFDTEMATARPTHAGPRPFARTSQRQIPSDPRKQAAVPATDLRFTSPIPRRGASAADSAARRSPTARRCPGRRATRGRRGRRRCGAGRGRPAEAERATNDET